mmetsp:Transcript_21887/g.31967  ORF Transcript_21887/g.31967 Transcript_21887/m.31967 type:complete len:154 (-) Transcript_21887:267-728(-)
MASNNNPFNPPSDSELAEAFRLFDKEGTGRISKQDIGSVLRSLGQNPTQGELQDMIEAIGGSADGTLDQASFEQKMSGTVNSAETKEEILEVFRVFDKTGEGLISVTDLRHLMKCLGQNMREEELDEIIRGEANVNDNGFVDYANFIDALMKG